MKEFLLNEICIFGKEVYTNKDRMEDLISSLKQKTKRKSKKKITELTVKVSLIEEQDLKL